MTPCNIMQMLAHMQIGVAWPEDYATASRLVSELNGLDLLYENLLCERDRLREQLTALHGQSNPFVTVED